MSTKWDGIEEFLAVATHSTFSRAAQSMHVSRTHMSRSIAQLEDRLRVRLIHRTTRAVKLTAAGEVFLEHCRQLVADRDAALAEIGESSDPCGDLYVTCSIELGERFVAPIALAVARQFPELRIHLDLSNRLVDLISEGFDVAIRCGNLASSSLLVATRISEHSMFTCATPEYFSSHPSLDAVTDLDHHDCLVGSSQHWHFSRNGEAYLYRPQPRWQCNNGEAILAAALQGMGICQLSDIHVRDYLNSGKLIPVLEKFSPPNDPIWAVYPGRRHIAPKTRHFLEALKMELPHGLRVGLESKPLNVSALQLVG